MSQGSNFTDNKGITHKDQRPSIFLLPLFSCSRDSTLQYLYKKSSIQKFTFKAFNFRHVMSSRLYVHCKVVTCRQSDTGSVCDRGCTEGSRHRRENKAFIMDKEVFLSLGPVNFQNQSEGHSARKLCIFSIKHFYSHRQT